MRTRLSYVLINLPLGAINWVLTSINLGVSPINLRLNPIIQGADPINWGLSKLFYSERYFNEKENPNTPYDSIFYGGVSFLYSQLFHQDAKVHHNGNTSTHTLSSLNGF